MGKERTEGFEVLKVTEANFLRSIEKGISFGQWVLLESIGDEIEPSLEPILQKNIKKSGSSYVI